MNTDMNTIKQTDMNTINIGSMCRKNEADCSFTMIKLEHYF